MTGNSEHMLPYLIRRNSHRLLNDHYRGDREREGETCGYTAEGMNAQDVCSGCTGSNLRGSLLQPAIITGYLLTLGGVGRDVGGGVSSLQPALRQFLRSKLLGWSAGRAQSCTATLSAPARAGRMTHGRDLRVLFKLVPANKTGKDEVGFGMSWNNRSA